MTLNIQTVVLAEQGRRGVGRGVPGTSEGLWWREMHWGAVCESFWSL